MEIPVELRTRVYVDGYNLYYGCLKGTPYKWLDLHALFDRILASVTCEVDGVMCNRVWQKPAVKYFTAPKLRRFASDDSVVASQAQYHNALRGHLGSSIAIVEGYFDAKPARAHVYDARVPPLESASVDIWKVEEKQSDVALALHAYGDALRGEVDQVVIVSNDTDLAPALRMIRTQTNVLVGLVTPTCDRTRHGNREFGELAHWIRRHVTQEELAASQLPSMVRDGKRVIHKPTAWYPWPGRLQPVLEEVIRIRGSKGAALKWLNQPNTFFQGRRPIDLLDSETCTRELLDYLARYTLEFTVPAARYNSMHPMHHPPQQR